MPGRVVIPQRAAIADVLEDLQLLVTCSLPDELEGHILYLPFR